MRTGIGGKNNRYFHSQWQLGSFCFLKFPTPQPVKLVGGEVNFWLFESQSKLGSPTKEALHMQCNGLRPEGACFHMHK
jgi:hypothetical protein